MGKAKQSKVTMPANDFQIQSWNVRDWTIREWELSGFQIATVWLLMRRNAKTRGDSFMMDPLP